MTLNFLLKITFTFILLLNLKLNSTMTTTMINRLENFFLTVIVMISIILPHQKEDYLHQMIDNC